MGKIVHDTMAFNMWMPIIEFAMYWAIRCFWRHWDQRKIQLCPGSYKGTNCRTIYSFVGLYSGGEFDIHSKYVFIATVVGITLSFGALIPQLFLLCLGSLCVIYIVERMAMTYSYVKPPMYDEKVNTFLLRILAVMPFFMYAPMAMLGFANRAIFLNRAQTFDGDVTSSGNEPWLFTLT